MSGSKDKVKILKHLLSALVFNSERVSNKYGTDDAGRKSDYTEWIDLRNSIAKAKEKL